MEEASDSINRHMDSLADELTHILRARVLAPFRGQEHSEADKAAFEQTMSRLRQLTLEAVVAGFQRAANEVITRSLSDSADGSRANRRANPRADSAEPHSFGMTAHITAYAITPTGKVTTMVTAARTRTRVGSTPR